MVDKIDLKSIELKARVGSSPTSGTLDKLGGLAQLARAPALHAGGQRFESVILHTIRIRRIKFIDILK